MSESRADQVRGLHNELAYLERQPNPNKSRIDQVKKQIDRFESEPKERVRETAAKAPDPEASAGVHLEHVVTHDGEKKPAKKAAAPRKAAAKKAPAKKAAAKA